MRTTEVIVELLIAGTLSVAGLLFVFLGLFPLQGERLLEISKSGLGPYSGPVGVLLSAITYSMGVIAEFAARAFFERKLDWTN